MRTSIPRLSTLLRKKPFPAPLPGSPLPRGIRHEEERSPYYNSKRFYPVTAGEVLGDRYQALVKVGWGVSSTVWLARDLHGHEEDPETIVALKITNRNSSTAHSERDIEKHIASANPTHRGRPILRTFSDAFEVRLEGSEGSHLCLAYPTTRETLSMYQRRFKGGRMPLPLVKTYIRLLLTGLEYLHAECRVVHTDLKFSNIMVTIEDLSILSTFLINNFETPQPFGIDDTGRHIYASASDLGPLKSVTSVPQFVDFGHAIRLPEDDDWGLWPIQPHGSRAPEVLLGTGWKMSADIWNMGVMLWNMIGGEDHGLFRNIYDSEGRYDARLHIAEMIGLLGPPPKEVIRRHLAMRGLRWPGPAKAGDGRECWSAEEFCGGRLFDVEGRFLHEGIVPKRRLEDTVPMMKGEEKKGFLDLVGGMLTWDGRKRKTAGELARHSFLQLKATKD